MTDRPQAMRDALLRRICEAMAEGIESNRASRPSGLTTLIPSNDRVVQ